jgi:hypothetical protein
MPFFYIITEELPANPSKPREIKVSQAGLLCQDQIDPESELNTTPYPFPPKCFLQKKGSQLASCCCLSLRPVEHEPL